MADTGVERQVVLLESHICIARSRRPFVALISLLILKLQKFYYPGSCSKPPLVEICGESLPLVAAQV